MHTICTPPLRLAAFAFAALSAFALAISPAGPAAAAPLLPNFGSATFNPGAAVNNPYFPLLDAQTRVYQGTDNQGSTARFEFTVVGAGPLILGLQTVSRRDRAFKDGQLKEDTFDYYAQDSAGNVWYLGEDVTNYRYDASGQLIGTDSASAWRAGVNGALPGFAMPALLAVGQNYYQEYAAADAALDNATTTAVGLTLLLASGSFTDVIQVLELTELDPAAREHKYYARGIGLIRVEEALDANFSNPERTVDLVRVGLLPVPSSIALVALAFVALGLARWRQR